MEQVIASIMSFAAEQGTGYVIAAILAYLWREDNKAKSARNNELTDRHISRMETTAGQVFEVTATLREAIVRLERGRDV